MQLTTEERDRWKADGARTGWAMERLDPDGEIDQYINGRWHASGHDGLVPEGHRAEVRLYVVEHKGEKPIQLLVDDATKPWFASPPPSPPPLVMARRGPVIRTGAYSVRDDDGVFTPLSATLFYAVSYWRDNRARLNQILSFIRDHSRGEVNCLRVSGALGGPYHTARGEEAYPGFLVDPDAPDYQQQLSGTIEYLYRHGFRTSLVCANGNIWQNKSTGKTFRQHIDQIIPVVHDHLHMIASGEMDNEGWQGNHPNLDDLRADYRYLQERLPSGILSGPTSPSPHPRFRPEVWDEIYAGLDASVHFYHVPRDDGESGRRWVRQARHTMAYLGLVGWSDEPPGPGASLNSVRDPEIIAEAVIATRMYRSAGFTIHSGAGIRDNPRWEDDPDLPRILYHASIAQRHLARYPNICEWMSFKGEDNGHPLHNQPNPYAGEGAHGALRMPAVVYGDQWLCFPFGIVESFNMQPKRACQVHLYNMHTDGRIHTTKLRAGEVFPITNHRSILIEGEWT